MAYRFNPPPNWPIDDSSWTPPPGWQPDPSWGPAPEGWNFWVDADADASSAPADSAAAPADSSGTDDATVDDDATHVASSGEQEATAPANGTEEPAAEPAAEPAPESAPESDDDATRLVSTDEQIGTDAGTSAPTHEDAVADSSGAVETAEYSGPDYQSGLAEQTPYEAGAPEQPGSEPQQPGFGAAGYGQGSPADYAQASPAGYGQVSPGGYGQGSPADYGQASPAGYGAPSPSGYGQASANGYAADYGSAPGVGSASTAWTASTGGNEPPQKGVIARFWWLGCIALFLVFLLIAAVVGGVILFNRDSGGSVDGSSTTQEQTSDDATDEGTSDDPTEEETTEEPTEEETTKEEREYVTPTNVPPIDESAEEVDIVSMEGTGTLAISMEWVADTELPDEYGGTVEPNPKGPEYLVMTGKMTVTEGTLGLNPYQFEVMTPYGGAITYSIETLSLEGSGFELDAPDEFEVGEEYTFRLLFPAQRAGGMTLEFNSYTDQYTWDVPA